MSRYVGRRHPGVRPSVGIKGVIRARMEFVRFVASLREEIGEEAGVFFLIRHLGQLSTREIGVFYGLSKQRIGQVENRATEKMRHYLESNGIDETNAHKDDRRPWRWRGGRRK